MTPPAGEIYQSLAVIFAAQPSVAQKAVVGYDRSASPRPSAASTTMRR